MIGLNGPLSRASRDDCEKTHTRIYGGGIEACVTQPDGDDGDKRIFFTFETEHIVYFASLSFFPSLHEAFAALKAARRQHAKFGRFMPAHHGYEVERIGSMSTGKVTIHLSKEGK